jgi:amino acid transporter
MSLVELSEDLPWENIFLWVAIIAGVLVTLVALAMVHLGRQRRHRL